MMKNKVPKFQPKTKVLFTEDYSLGLIGKIDKNTKGEVLGIEEEVENEGWEDTSYYIIALDDDKLKKATLPIWKVDKVCVEDKMQDKHNILNGLTNTDAIKPNYYQYRGGDVFDMAKHFELDYPLGSALKYLLRAGHKDPAKKVEDLNKCIECIKRYIELEG